MYRTLQPSLSSRFLPAAILLLAPAPLAADGSLAVLGLPMIAAPGKPLTFQVAAQGIPAGVPIEITFRMGEEVTATHRCTVPVSGTLTDIYFIPETTPRAWLTITARAGEAASEPRILLIQPGPSGSAPDPSGAGPAAPAPPGASPAAPEPKVSMAGMPDEIHSHIREFLDSGDMVNLKRTSRGMVGPMTSTTRTLRIAGNLNLHQLDRLLSSRPNVESVTLGHTPNLASREIVSALQRLPRLRELVANSHHITAADAVEIARTHSEAGFDSLSVGFGLADFRAADLLNLPERMRTLRIQSTTLVGPEFARFTGLQCLEISKATAFTGQGLPGSLQRLAVYDAIGFQTSALPPRLLSLTIQRCAGSIDCTQFPPSIEELVLRQVWQNGSPRLPALKRLMISQCRGFTREDIEAMVAAARGLRNLAVEHVDHGILAAAPATLETIETLNGLPTFATEGVTDGDLARFVNLKHLTLRHCHLVGWGLPAGLQKLDLAYCPSFRTEGLKNIPLRFLRLERCDSADGEGIPATLHSLEVTHCERFPLKAVAEAIGRMPSLVHFAFLTQDIALPGDVEKIRLRAQAMRYCFIWSKGAILIDHGNG